MCALLGAILGSACAESAPEWHETGSVRWRELTVRGASTPGFTSLDAGRTGVSFVNDPSEEMTRLNQHLANGAGVALGDVNGDALVDILLTNTRGANGLYLNRGGFRFDEVGATAGLHRPDRHPTGVALVDLDGDGDLDALMSSMGAPVAYLENAGDGTFQDRSAAAGFATTRAGSTMTLADIDADGDLDLYAANYRLYRAADAFSPADRRETPVLEERAGTWVVNEKYREYYEVVLSPEGVLSWEFGEEDDLYINDGSGTFARIPVMGDRFRDSSGTPLAKEPQEWGLSARFRDLNDDGAPDLYVANDFESPDHVWINDGDGSFQLLGAPDLTKTSHASMSVAFADVDANGTTDIFVADMLPVSTRLRKTQRSTLMERRPMQGDLTSTMQVNRNTLLMRAPGGGYTEVAQQAHLDASGWTWGTEFVDVDLDGLPDLLAATGHRWNALDADTGDRLRRTPATAGAEWHDVIDLFPELRLPNRAFRNKGDGTFDPVVGAWGLDVGSDISHGLATGDLDGDGDLDVVINRMGDPALVLRNDSNAGRIGVRLRGLAPNTGAVGAVIHVRGGPVEQAREVGAGGLYLSHSDGLQVFATGGAQQLTIEVRWPSGGVTLIGDASPNRLYEISETGEEPAVDTSTASAEPGPLFEDRSAWLGHIHTDLPFVSEAGQPLLPRHLSQLGPGIAWTDSDGDGDPDLVVGAGAGGSLTTFQNVDGRLRAGGASARLEYDATTILPGIDGRTLLVGVANYEAPSPEVARAVAPAWSVRIGTAGLGPLTPALSSDGGSTGPLASADVDGDGDLDVFVGGRAYQSAYPIVPTSRLFLREDDGTLVYDSVRSAPLSRVGLVSGATFTDIDGDADSDLVLAIDWGPPRLFINEGGRFFDQTRDWGLAPYQSWWNGVTTGDLDGDGRTDLVLTSWGRNTGLSPTADRPLLGYWGDFDRSGTLDFLLGTFDDRIGAVAPISDLVSLSRGLPFVRTQTTTTFEAYADASMAQLLGPSMGAATVNQIMTLDHMVFFNRGDHFEAVPLPAPSQVAPAHGVAVADFNGDGAEDVLLAQNFFPNALGAERHDAGRGLLLLGDGAGGLRALTPAESGISLAGDQRGLALADFDADGRVDVAIGQNSGPTALLHNLGATPGLRVRLEGGPKNPVGVGASIRVVYEDGTGPFREVRLGSGFWSSDDPVQVLGLRALAQAIEVRWPSGELQRVPVAAGATEITVRREF